MMSFDEFVASFDEEPGYLDFASVGPPGIDRPAGRERIRCAGSFGNP